MIHLRWITLAILLILTFLPLQATTADDVHRVVLLPHQYKAWTSKKPFKALVTGLGGGKTWVGARWTISKAIQYPETIGLVTMNSYAQSKDVVVPELEAACEEFGVRFWWRSRNQHPTLFVDVGHAIAEVRVRSTDRTHVDKIRGAEYGYWWGDEVRDATDYAINVVVLMRLRCTRIPQVEYLWTTTPNGYDHIYQRHVDDNRDDCELIQARTDQNPHLRDDYADRIKSSLSEDMARQEGDGEFVHIGAGQVYRSFNRNIHRRPCTYERNTPLILTTDFNVGRMAWTILQAKSGGTVEAIDQVIGTTIYDAVDQLAEKFPKHAPGFTVYGDAAGNSRNHAGVTDYQDMVLRMREHGIRHTLRVPKSNPAVKDRVNSVNAMLTNAKGQHRFHVDPKCVWLLRDLEQVKWHKNRTDIDKPSDSDLTHASDGVGYYMFAEHRPNTFRSQPGYEPRRRR